MKSMVAKLYVVEEKTGCLSSSELHPINLAPGKGAPLLELNSKQA